MKIPPLVLKKLDSERGIQRWIMCLPFIVLLTSFGQRKSVCIACYEKAFDRVERAFLWQNLLDSGVDGRIMTVIKDMYRKAKSCVKTGNVIFIVIQAFARGKFVTCTFCHLSK